MYKSAELQKSLLYWNYYYSDCYFGNKSMRVVMGVAVTMLRSFLRCWKDSVPKIVRSMTTMIMKMTIKV